MVYIAQVSRGCDDGFPFGEVKGMAGPESYEAQAGDVFLCDSDRIGAKIVKFFMQSPTVYQQIWRFMTHTLQSVRYYHAGMILSDTQMIEQQGKVQYGDTQKILSRRITIYRKKSLTTDQQALLKERAIAQLGQGYGVAEVIGHTLTWLTGIRYFIVLLGALTRQNEICVNRVVRWYNHIDAFGSKTIYEATTKTVDEYCTISPDWEIVYFNA